MKTIIIKSWDAKASHAIVLHRKQQYPPISALPELVPSSSRPILSLPQCFKDLSIQVNPAPIQSGPTDPSDTVTCPGK